MNRRHVLAGVTFAAFALTLLPGSAVSQPKSLREQLVGTWKLVSSDTVDANGSRTPTFGQNPKGMAVFDAAGRYSLQQVRSENPKFASNNRATGTADENKAAVQGSLSHFGTYTVNEADRTFTFRIEGSSFPNWEGTEQKRPFAISGDELKWTAPGASGGGSGELVWKRVR